VGDAVTKKEKAGRLTRTHDNAKVEGAGCQSSTRKAADSRGECHVRFFLPLRPFGDINSSRLEATPLVGATPTESMRRTVSSCWLWVRARELGRVLSTGETASALMIKKSLVDVVLRSINKTS